MANLREHIRQSSGYKWWILGMIMLGTFMAVLDVTVVNVGLPAIMSAFGIGISSAEWVITAYMITMTIMLPSAGWFADRFGNKRVYILGLVLFTLGSWLCGKASSDPFLIGSRALQGVGSGIIQALGLAIVTREFKPAERGLALGLWSMAAAASISFGPLLGGYLVDAYSWHKIFDVNVPVDCWPSCSRHSSRRSGRTRRAARSTGRGLRPSCSSCRWRSMRWRGAIRRRIPAGGAHPK